MNSQSSHQPADGEEERLFAWAIVVPALIKHYSITAPADHNATACACSPGIRRTIEQWARHVSDEIAHTLL